MSPAAPLPDLYQRIVESMEEGVVLEDDAEHIVFVNPALCRLLDYTPEELISKHWRVVVAPDFIPVAQAESVLRRQGVSSRYENVLLTRHGERVPVISSVRPLFDAPPPTDEADNSPPRLVGVLSVITDIRRQKETEAELRASRERFRAIFETALDSIFIKDEHLRYIAVNPAMERLFGLAAEALIGKNDTDIFGEAAGAHIQAADATVLTGEVLEEISSKPVGDHIKTFHTIKTPMRDAEGQIIGLCGIARDITDREEAANALRRGEETLRSLIEQSADGIVLVDSAGKVIEWNRAAERISDLPRSEVLGQAIWDIQFRLAPGWHQTPELYNIMQAAFKTVLQRRNDDSDSPVFEEEIETAAGKSKHIQMVSFPIQSGERPLVGAIFRDITEQRLRENEVAQRSAQLESVRRLAMDITSQLDLDTLLESIVARAMELLGGTEGSLYLYRQDQGVLEWVVALSPNRSLLQGRTIRRGEGLAGAILAEGQPRVLQDYSSWSGRICALDDIRQGGMVGVPVRWGDEFLGVLTVIHKHPAVFAAQDADLLSVFAGHAAVAVRNARLLQAERHAREFSDALAEAAAVVTSTLDVDQVLDRILEQVERVVDGDAVNIMVVNDRLARIVRSRGYERFDGAHVIAYVTHDVAAVPNLARMHDSGETVLVTDIPANPAWVAVPGLEWQQSYVAAPVLLSGDTIGFLNVDGSRPHQFDQKDANRLQSFADYCAIAISNARLHAQTRRDVETKAILLREVNHRVKNNLSAIIGLIYAEQRRSGGAETATLEHLVGRIQGLGEVHSLLTASEWSPLPLDELAQTIVHGVLHMMPPDKEISVEVRASAEVAVTPDQAHSLALVLNEMTTNSVKHAFPEQARGAITIDIDEEGDVVLLTFRDDGTGYAPAVLESDKRDVGLFLVENIVRRELRGVMHLCNEDGAVTQIRFKRQLGPT
jgi:PAS domain S-box-containing protein